MATATKEEQLERLVTAKRQVELAIHHLALSKNQPLKRDGSIFAQGAINALEAFLSYETVEGE